MLIIVILFVSSKIYNGLKDSELMEKTNTQLKSLLEPFINNTVVVMNEDKYLYRIKHVKLSDEVEIYKKELRCLAYVTFEVYKNEVKEQNLFDTMGIYIEVWKLDAESDFFTSATTSFNDLSYKKEIFWRFTDSVFDTVYENIKRDSSEVAPGSSYSSSWGQGTSDEDKIEINGFGEIISPGEVNYSYIRYSEGLSMKFTTTFFIKDFKKYHEMHIMVEKAEGDFHPLWDMKADNIEEIKFHEKDNYENIRTISDSGTIQKLVEYLKSMSFTKHDEQVQDVEFDYFIDLNEYEHHVILTKNAVYTNDNHAECIGKEYVDQILEILGEVR